MVMPGKTYENRIWAARKADHPQLMDTYVCCVQAVPLRLSVSSGIVRSLVNVGAWLEAG